MFFVYCNQAVLDRDQTVEEQAWGIMPPTHLEWRLVARLSDNDVKGMLALQRKYKSLKVKKVKDSNIGFDAIKGDLEPPARY